MGYISRHSLPESPPDSSSEHPYSPQDTCEQNLNTSETIYTTLGQPMYKPTLLNPIITDNLILGPHIVVTDQNSEQNLLENGGILINDDLRSSQTLINNRIIPENIASDAGPMILPEAEANRQQQILVQPASDTNQNYAERSDTALLRLMKNGEYEKSQLVHLGFGSNVDIAPSICESNLENMQNVYTNLQNAPKKRKISQEAPLVKSEPGK